MQVILQGSVRHFPPAELLSFLCGRGQTGTLDLETTGKKTRIVFSGDKITWAESSKEAEAADVVLDAFEWTAGTFTLLDSAVLPDGAKAISLDLAPLLEEAKRRAEAASLYSDETLFQVVENPAAQQQLSLNFDQLKILFKLSGGRTFAKLIEDLGIPKRDLNDRLRDLVKLGLVAVATPEAKTAEQPAPKRRITFVGSLTPDNAPENVHPLLDAEQTIGRAPSNSITIADGSVSHNHARITKSRDGFVIEDLKSRNGTFVNGEKVTEPRLLADGDLIRLGKVILTFNVARDINTGEVTTPEVHV